MKLIRVLPVFPAALLALSITSPTRAASIVSVIYVHDNQQIAKAVYTGSDGGANSDPADYWGLIATAPEFVSASTIKPDQPGGKIATFKGKVKIALTIRNSINMGIVQLDSPKLIRDDAKSNDWYLPEAEFRRVDKIVQQDLKPTITVSYSLKYNDLVKTIYAVPDASKSKPASYWKLLGTEPDVVYRASIKPDKPNGKIATLTGDVKISVTTRPRVEIGGNTKYSGHLETDTLQLVRDDAKSSRWYVPAAEQKRLAALIQDAK